MSFCMMNNCTVEIIPASADATAQADADPPNGASIYAAIAGLAPAKCRLFRLLLAIF